MWRNTIVNIKIQRDYSFFFSFVYLDDTINITMVITLKQVYLLKAMDCATLPHAKSTISRCTPSVIIVQISPRSLTSEN